MKPIPVSDRSNRRAHLHRLRLPIAAGLLAASAGAPLAVTPLPVAELRRTDAVDFEKEILPVLRKNCLACHNQTRAKADLILETPATIARGGASGTAVVPGQPDRSLLFTSAAHRVDDLVMPPVGNKSNAENLTADELARLRLWIVQGAQGEVRASRSLVWQPIPTTWNSSYAVAVDRNSRLVACARANRVDLYDARTGKPAGRLEDPDLQGAAQRDVVSAVAFSPTEDILATAGFREVRLWRRRPAHVDASLRADADTTWTSAALSEDRTLIALVGASGDLRVHRIASGESVGSWPAITTTPALLAFSPDATRLAVAGASGTLRILPLSGAAPAVEQALGGETSGLAWFDSGRALATVRRESKTIQTWRRSENADDKALASGKDLVAHDAPVVSIASDPSGALFSASRDGIVRRWAPDGSSATETNRFGGPVLEIRATSTPGRLVARLESGGTEWLDFGGKPESRRTGAGDPRLEAAVAAARQAVGLARLELAFAEKTIQESEAETKKTAETLAKTREKREGHAKAHAEKEQSLAQQQKAEATATQERDGFAAELEKAAKELAAAEKAAADSQAAAKEAAERSFATQRAADQASRLAADLERIVQSLAGRPDDPSLAKAREAAESAVAEAAAKTRLTGEAKTRAEKALEELAQRAFAAGQKKAVADRAQAELPPRQKQAEERIAAAKKAVGDLQPQLEKARVTLEGSDKDIQIAEQSSQKAEQALRHAKESAETAQGRIAESESRLAQHQKAAAESAARSPAFAISTPSGDSLVTWAQDGTAILWDLATGAGTYAFSDASDAGPPIALFAVDDHAALLVRSRTVSRVDFTPRWERFRTLGGEVPATASTPPALADRVNALAFSPDGTLLATGGGEPSRSGEIKLWNTSDGSPARDLGSVHSDCVLALAFSPRGDRLASGGADRFARISDVASGKLLRSLEGHTHHVMGVAWLAHGGVLASAGAEGTVKIWNPFTGDRLKNVDGFGKEVTGLRAVGLTHQFVAVSGSGQGRIVRDNGEKVRDLPGAPSFFQGVDTAADGTWAAVAADDGTLRIWDLDSGKERLALPPK